MVKASRLATKAAWVTKGAPWETRAIKVAWVTRVALWATRVAKAVWVVLIVAPAAWVTKARAQAEHHVLETWIALQVKA